MIHNYKGYTIHGKHGLGFRLTSNGVVWDFNRLKSAMAFIDEVTL